MTDLRITDLQRRILRAIEDGALGIGPIAADLGVSERTVKRSITSLGRKLQRPIPAMPGRARKLGVRF